MFCASKHFVNKRISKLQVQYSKKWITTRALQLPSLSAGEEKKENVLRAKCSQHSEYAAKAQGINIIFSTAVLPGPPDEGSTLNSNCMDCILN